MACIEILQMLAGLAAKWVKSVSGRLGMLHPLIVCHSCLAVPGRACSGQPNEKCDGLVGA